MYDWLDPVSSKEAPPFLFLDQVGLDVAARDGVLLKKYRASSVYETYVARQSPLTCRTISIRSKILKEGRSTM